MPKNNRHGKSSTLSAEEFALLIDNLPTLRDKVIASICFYTSARISECLSLEKTDITDNYIVFRKANTKGKIATREIPIHPRLRKLLQAYLPTLDGRQKFLFPSSIRNQHISDVAFMRTLQKTCNKLEIDGFSSHGFRRSCLNNLYRKGVPLPTIQKISGHKSLQNLAEYLDVSDREIVDAVMML